MVSVHTSTDPHRTYRTHRIKRISVSAAGDRIADASIGNRIADATFIASFLIGIPSDVIGKHRIKALPMSRPYDADQWTQLYEFSYKAK